MEWMSISFATLHFTVPSWGLIIQKRQINLPYKLKQFYKINMSGNCKTSIPATIQPIFSFNSTSSQWVAQLAGNHDS
jgi:hypothetical protein